MSQNNTACCAFQGCRKNHLRICDGSRHATLANFYNSQHPMSTVQKQYFKFFNKVVNGK